jgi:hypothetical protein
VWNGTGGNKGNKNGAATAGGLDRHVKARVILLSPPRPGEEFRVGWYHVTEHSSGPAVSYPNLHRDAVPAPDSCHVSTPSFVPSRTVEQKLRTWHQKF